MCRPPISLPMKSSFTFGKEIQSFNIYNISEVSKYLILTALFCQSNFLAMSVLKYQKWK